MEHRAQVFGQDAEKKCALHGEIYSAKAMSKLKKQFAEKPDKLPKLSRDSHQWQIGSFETACKINGLRGKNQREQPFSFSLLFSLWLFKSLESISFLDSIEHYYCWSG